MRTYAPAEPGAVLAALLAEPSLARGVVHHAVLPAARRRLRRLPGLARPAHRAGLAPRAASSGRTPTRPRRWRPSTPARTSSSSRPRPRASRCATRCPSSRRSPTIRPRARSSCSRPRRSARTRWPSSASCRGRRRPVGPRPRPTTATRRRRSARRSGPPARSWSPTRTCSTRRSSPTTPSGSSCSSSCGHRHRRAAHVPRRVRQPRRQRPAPAAADLRPLRLAPGHRLLLGDDREPGRAGGDADRPAGTARRPQRGAGRRAPRRPGRPAGPRARRAGRAARRVTLAQRWALPFLRAGRQTIVFGRSRVAVELLLTGLRESLRESHGPRTPRPRLSRRLPADRAARRSSAGCATARSSASSRPTRSSSASTSAASTSSILAGYPGSIAATWQQFGRAGRRQGTSVAILVASGAPVDQYVVHHPEFLLEGTPEEARLDPDNLHVLLAHLRAATFELPFEPGEVVRAGPGRRPARLPGRGGPRPPGRRRALVLGERELPGLGDLAADRRAGERGHHRHDAGPAAGPRRGRPVQRPGPRPRARDLPPRVAPVPRRPARVGRAQGVRPPRRRRPLHLRQPGGHAQAARGLRRGRRRPAAGGSTAR